MTCLSATDLLTGRHMTFTGTQGPINNVNTQPNVHIDEIGAVKYHLDNGYYFMLGYRISIAEQMNKSACMFTFLSTYKIKYGKKGRVNEPTRYCIWPTFLQEN